MYQLMVSYDCGISYDCEGRASTPEELYPKAKEYDEQGLRWFIEDENGEIKNISLTQQRILSRLATMNS